MSRPLRFFISGLILSAVWTSAAGRGSEVAQSSTVVQRFSPAHQHGRLRQLKIEAPEGSAVAITADSSSLADAVSYNSGDKFVVVIPQASVASVQSDVRGQGFISVIVEQLGEDVAVTFRLQTGASARLDRRTGGLAVLFTSPQIAAVPASTSTKPETALATEPKAASPNNLSPAPAGPVQGAGPISSTQVGDLLAKLFGGDAKKVSADTSNVDLSVPESAAEAALGVTPSSVIRPASPRAFASAFINGLDQQGHFQTGLALDTAPFLLFNGENVTLLDYNNSYVTRLLTRTQFSFATAKGASASDTSTRLGLGLNLTLFDNGDARIYHPERYDPTTGEGDVLSCFADPNKLKLPQDIRPLLNGASADERKAHDALVARINSDNKVINDKVADECRKGARKANWNKSSWTVAFAPTWVSKNGQTSSFKWNGGALWTSFAYGFEGVPSLSKIGQLIFHARYRNREVVPDPLAKGKFVTQSSNFLGARFRAGNPAFAFNIEDSVIRSRPIGRKATTLNRFAFGAEARVTDNFYLVISAGGNVGGAQAQNKGFVMTSFKYGFNRKSQFNPQPTQ